MNIKMNDWVKCKERLPELKLVVSWSDIKVSERKIILINGTEITIAQLYDKSNNNLFLAK